MLTLVWTPVSLHDFPPPFQKITLRRKQGNAAFLKMGRAGSHIFNSTVTANN